MQAFVSTGNVSRPQLRMRPIAEALPLRSFTPADIKEVSRLLKMSPARTCDFSIGGIYMWVDYFKYRMAIVNDTLFILGASESDRTSPAFSFPVGTMAPEHAIRLVCDYCQRHRIRPRFTAVPEECIAIFRDSPDWEVKELTDWSDYLYDINSLATFSGKKLNKKRNHLNRFMADNPDARLVEVTPADAPRLIAALDSWGCPPDSPTADEERRMTLDVIANLDHYPFEGAYLTGRDGRIVAFTFGEVINDTLFVHIEKMDHAEPGAGETICHLFAQAMLAKHPSLRYINREEDCGDPSLRFAKESYHPLTLLRKYEVIHR